MTNNVAGDTIQTMRELYKGDFGMERKYLIAPGGNFYKAAMHTHSTVSDGRCTPAEVKEIYKSMGYSVVAFTDHSRMVCHNDLTDSDFLAINGYEFDVTQTIPGYKSRCYHLNFYAKTPDIDYHVMFDPTTVTWCYSEDEIKTFKYKGEIVHNEYSIEFVNKAIKEANDNGFLVCYNHPVWSRQYEPDFLPLEGLFAFEIYNHGAQLDDYNGFNPHMYTSMVSTGKLPGCFATDDSHMVESKDPTSPHCDAGGGYIMIKAEELTYEAIISALENRDFYASTGVEIQELYIEYGNVYIRTSPCKQITMITDTKYRQTRRAKGNELTEAVLEFDEDSKVFWIMCEDENGKIGATCAHPVEPIKFYA